MVDFSRFANTDFSNTPFQYVIFGKGGGLLEVELNEAQYLGFKRDQLALKSIGNTSINGSVVRDTNDGNTVFSGDFIIDGYAVCLNNCELETDIGDTIYVKVSLETLDKESTVKSNGYVGGTPIDNTIIDDRMNIETTKRQAITFTLTTTNTSGSTPIAVVHDNGFADITLHTISLSDTLTSIIEDLQYKGILNAFDGVIESGYYTTTQGKPLITSTSHSVMNVNPIKCEVGEHFKIIYDGTLNRPIYDTFIIFFYNENGEFLKYIGSSKTTTSKEFIIPEGASYLNFNVASDTPVMTKETCGKITVYRNYNSNVLPNGTVTSSNADFAEVAMWADGNPDNEDRLCYFVSISKTEDGITMRKATSTSDVIGVTTKNPAFSANASGDKYENEELKKEYNYVAFAGFATVIDNGTCEVHGRCMPDDNGCAVPSNNSMGYQIIERVDANKVLILVEPDADMLNRIKTDIDELKEESNELKADLSTIYINHNNILRCKDITPYFTDKTLRQRIANNYDDIYVGDYINMGRAVTCKDSYEGTVGSQYVTVASCGGLKGKGDSSVLNKNHLVMIPGRGVGGTQHFGRHAMNASHTTIGGYKDSVMNTEVIGAPVSEGSIASEATINQQLRYIFGDLLQTSRERVTNTMDASLVNRFGSATGASSNWSWESMQAILMSEIEVYGSIVWSSSGYDTGTARRQLDIFRLCEEAINNRTAWYWLKDIASASRFCDSSYDGYAYYGSAGYSSSYVRPRFIIA